MATTKAKSQSQSQTQQEPWSAEKAANDLRNFSRTSSTMLQGLTNYQYESVRAIYRTVLSLHRQLLQTYMEALDEQAEMLDRFEAQLREQVNAS